MVITVAIAWFQHCLSPHEARACQPWIRSRAELHYAPAQEKKGDGAPRASVALLALRILSYWCTASTKARRSSYLPKIIFPAVVCKTLVTEMSMVLEIIFLALSTTTMVPSSK